MLFIIDFLNVIESVLYALTWPTEIDGGDLSLLSRNARIWGTSWYLIPAQSS